MATSVAELCAVQKMTLARLAELTGLAEERVMAIALGRWTPSPNERKQISGALGCAISDIAWGHRTPIQHIHGL